MESSLSGTKNLKDSKIYSWSAFKNSKNQNLNKYIVKRKDTNDTMRNDYV